MANLTITVDKDTLLKARQRALQQSTSVNAVLRTYLEQYAGGDEIHRRTTEAILELTEQSSASSMGQHWSRDEIHER